MAENRGGGGAASREPIVISMPSGRAARPGLPKRFYARAHVARGETGRFALLLDGKPAKTPARADFQLPGEALAEAVAEEWNRQGETIDPMAMPLTRLANTTIDGVVRQAREVLAEVVGYLRSDLLLYRGAEPQLAVAQAEAWDPVLDWCREAFGARFVLAEGVMPVEQPREALDAMAEAARLASGEGPAAPFRLAALHVMTTLTGSALLSLAVAHGKRTPLQAWSAAHVDETFQERYWGQDQEAMDRRARRWTEMEAAALTLRLLG